MTISNLPIIRGLLRRFEILKASLQLYIPPGHYYSPIVSKKEILENRKRIFEPTESVSGVDLNLELQKHFIIEFSKYHDDFVNDYDGGKIPFALYTPKNGFYSYTDGIFLYSIMRHFSPKRIIEAGSGYSSALMIDVMRTYLNKSTQLTFVEPYPENRLLKLVSSGEPDFLVIKDKIQNLPLQRFRELEENDILFIDSSHVSKTGSDVNFLFFRVLPILNKGVLIHIHDIYFPFEYPESHVLGDRWFSWNEAYLLYAFLGFNNQFEILFWNSCLENLEFKLLKEHFPSYFKGGSASIWLRRM